MYIIIIILILEILSLSSGENIKKISYKKESFITIYRYI